MIVLVVVASLVIGFVVGAASIGVQAARMGAQRRQPVWRLAEARQFVIGELAADTTAVLSPHQVDDLLARHVNLLQFSGDDPAAQGPVIARDRDDVVNELYLTARRDGHELTKPAIEDVIAAHWRFLTAIGALAPAPDAPAPDAPVSDAEGGRRR